MPSAAGSPVPGQPLLDESPASLDAPLIEVFGLLLEACSGLVARLDHELVEVSGVPLQTFEVLIRLARTPGESLPIGELGQALALSSGGATRLIDRLVAAGLVAREPDTGDRRVVRVGLTADGRSTVRAALPVHLHGLERHLAAPCRRASSLLWSARSARFVKGSTPSTFRPGDRRDASELLRRGSDVRHGRRCAVPSGRARSRR